MGLSNSGALTGSGGAIVAEPGSIIDLSEGSLSVGSLTLALSANSLLIVPQNFTQFKSFIPSPLSLTHTVGSTLTVSATQGFSGIGSLSDAVSCQGTISATAGSGILPPRRHFRVGAGSVNLGSGSYTVNNTQSMTSGSLTAAAGYVGFSGTGSFTHSGGTNALTGLLTLGSGTSDSGMYSLSGAAMLSASSELIGLSGSGTFTQSGGTNNVSGAHCIWPRTHWPWQTTVSATRACWPRRPNTCHGRARRP